MRIALVVTGGLHPSGREQVIPVLLTLVERLAREHEVHAFVVRHLPDPTSYSLHGAAVHDLGRPEGLLRQWRALLGSLRASGPFDVIHGIWADPAGLLAAGVGRRLGVPSVVTCDSGEFVSLPEVGYGLQRTLRGGALVFLATRLATVVHVTSDYMETLAARHGARTVKIPLGVAIERSQSARRRDEGPPWRLLQVAALNQVKDHQTLLRAVALVRRTLDVRLDLVGEDTLGGRLQHEAASLGMREAVAFHGFVSHAELPGFIEPLISTFSLRCTRLAASPCSRRQLQMCLSLGLELALSATGRARRPLPCRPAIRRGWQRLSFSCWRILNGVMLSPTWRASGSSATMRTTRQRR